MTRAIAQIIARRSAPAFIAGAAVSRKEDDPGDDRTDSNPQMMRANNASVIARAYFVGEDLQLLSLRATNPENESRFRRTASLRTFSIDVRFWADADPNNLN
jgi:hypothetical protein